MYALAFIILPYPLIFTGLPRRPAISTWIEITIFQARSFIQFHHSYHTELSGSPTRKYHIKGIFDAYAMRGRKRTTSFVFLVPLPCFTVFLSFGREHNTLVDQLQKPRVFILFSHEFPEHHHAFWSDDCTHCPVPPVGQDERYPNRTSPSDEGMKDRENK